MLKPSNELSSEVRSDNLILSIVDLDINEGESFEIPFTFTADDKIEGLQIEFENEDISIESIELETYDYEVYINNSIESKTRLVLIGDNPSKEINGTIIGTSYKKAKISDIISISSDFHVEVVYDDLNLSGISLDFGTTSIDDDVVNLDNLVISPNPVKDYFSIQIPTNLSEISTFTITNTQGQVVIRETILNSNLLINRSDLSGSGLYVLTWSIGNQSIHKKVIIL